MVWIFLRSLDVICYDRWVLSEGHRNYFKDCCLVNSQPTLLFSTYLNSMVILSKTSKADNFESQNSLKLSFTNIWGLYSNFVDFIAFLESNSPDILALCEANLDDSIDSGNLSVWGYLPLIRKDSSIHMASFGFIARPKFRSPLDTKAPGPPLIYLVGPLAISDTNINICVRRPNTCVALK